MEEKSDIKRKNLDSGYAEISEKLKNIDEKKKEIKVCNKNIETLRKKHIVKDKITYKNQNSLFEYLTKLLENYSENDILECLDKRKKIKSNLKVTADNKPPATLNKTMNNEKFKNTFIKKTSIQSENLLNKFVKGKEDKKTIFQPESNLMNISNPKIIKKNVKVLKTSFNTGIKKASSKKLKLSSPKIPVPIPEQSFSSLLETPSSSTSSLLKSATINIHPESDQSQSKTSFTKTNSKEFKDTEKQWQLQKKVNDLSIQVTQLEKKVFVLKNENETLKRQWEDQKGTDEKLKNLKKRNAELSHTVKRLEEAAKKNYGIKTRESKTTIEKKKHSLKQDLKRHEMFDAQHLLGKHQQLINYINSLNAQLYTGQGGLVDGMDELLRVANKERLVLERENDKLSRDLSSKATLCENLEEQLKCLQQELSAIKQDEEEQGRRDVDVMNGCIKIESLEASLQQYEDKVATLNEKLLKSKEENQCIIETNTQLTEQLDSALRAEETIHRMECEMETQRKEHMELTATLATLNSSLDVSKKQYHSQQELLAEMQERNDSLQEEVQTTQNKLQMLSQNHTLEVEKFEKMNSDLKVKLEEAEKQERDLRKLLEDKSNCETERKNIENHQVIERTDGSKSIKKNDDEEHSVKRSSVTHETSNKIEASHKPSIEDEKMDKEEEAQEEQESHVFQALYDYDPAEYSPNTEPSEELHLNEGDYVLVHGNMDEDGFYYGENMDGVKGFIPSNFVRKLPDEEQEEFYQVLSMTTPNNNNIVPDLLADDLSSNTIKEDMSKSTPNDQGDIEPPIGLNVEVDDENNSLLITWLPITLSNVASSSGTQVLGYCVYLDGVEVNVVQGAAEDHLMLTGLDEEFLSSAHIITLTTLSTNHTESKHCSPFFLNHLPSLMNANREKNNKNISIDVNSLKIDKNGEDAASTSHKTKSSHNIFDNCTASKYEDNAEITYRNGHKQHNVEERGVSDKDLDTEHLSIEGVTLDELQQRGWKHFPGKRKSQQNIKQNDQHLKCQQQSIQHLQQQFLQRSVSVNDVDTSKTHKASIHLEFLPTSQQTLPVQLSFVTSAAFNHSIQHRNFSASNDNSSTSLDSLACCNDHDENDGGSGDEIDDHCYYEHNNSNEKNAYLDTNNNKFSSKKQVTGALKFSNKTPRDDNVQQNNFNYKSIVLTNNTTLTPLNIQDRMSDSELIDYEDEEGDSLFDNHHQVDDADDGMAKEEEEEEEEEHMIDEDHVRLFIALFSYDPSTMSPNPDADEVELTFKEGQIIKIYGSKDDDGFFIGEAGGIRGLVPCNMVCEVQVGSDEMSKQLMMESSRALSASILSAVSSSIHPAINLMDTSTNEIMENATRENHIDKDELLESPEVMMMIALYDYNPIENSPNEDIEHELPFKKGDVMEVVGGMDNDGFYYAQIKGKFGMVPSNFIAPYHCHQIDLPRSHCSPSTSPSIQYPTIIEQSLYSKEPSTDHPKGFYAATDV